MTDDEIAQAVKHAEQVVRDYPVSMAVPAHVRVLLHLAARVATLEAELAKRPRLRYSRNAIPPETLTRIGDTVHAWVNEGDLYMVGDET